jgi:hypothetical protein
LILHALSVETARNILAADRLLDTIPSSEKQGDIEAKGVTLHWRTWSEKTAMDNFVRRNVAVKVGHEPEVMLFMYRVK